MLRKLSTLLVALALVAGACSSNNDSNSSSTISTSGPTSTTEAPESDEPEEPLEPLTELRIYHPETLAFAAPFTFVNTDGELGEVVEKLSIDTWTTPDILRSLLVNNQTDVTAVPSYLGANLYNRGVDVRLAAVLVWGLLWVIGPDGTEADWKALRGQTVLIPFQNDMPDLVFQFLAKANGLTPGEDFTVEYYAQPPEVVARLMSGGGTWAVLPEHLATVALAQASQADLGLGRVFDLQQEWAKATGSEPRIPQAGIVVPGWLADERPDVLAAVLDALEASVGQVKAASDDTVAALAEAQALPAPIVAQIIPRLNLDVVPAKEAQSELERLYSELATMSPEIIGGGLPDDAFYLADPRS